MTTEYACDMILNFNREKDNMHKKVELLEKALESLGSKLQLRRILERSAEMP